MKETIEVTEVQSLELSELYHVDEGVIKFQDQYYYLLDDGEPDNWKANLTHLPYFGTFLS